MGFHGGAIQEPKSQSLARQGSLYNLTLDEVQSQLGDLGKPLGSMNLDELLKSVWTVECSQAVVDNNGGGVISQPQAATVSLQRQPSVGLSGDISKKTVEEVWREIEKGDSQDGEARDSRQGTFGGMTLEDFLSKAGLGVVADSIGQADVGSVLGGDPSQNNVLGADTSQAAQQSQWMQYQVPHQHQPNMAPVVMHGHPVQKGVPVGVGPSQIMDVGYPEIQVSMSPPALMGAVPDMQTPGRKRDGTGEVVQRSVEKKQKRMIKNRESAARSRARKQAYTQELENKVSRLEEENERLRKQRDMEKVLPDVPPPEPKYQLRRTSSSTF